jgi:hypothetical protein
VNTAVNSESEGAKALPEWVTKKSTFPYIPPADFALDNPPFEPVHQPDLLRENPRVLGVFASQIDVIRAPMRSLDIQVQSNSNGEPDTTLIGVLVNPTVGEKDIKAVSDEVRRLVGDIRKSQNARRAPVRPTPPPAPRQPVNSQPPGSFPGSPGGSPGSSNPYGADSTTVVQGQREDKTVRYYAPQDFDQNNGNFQLAETVYPLRAVMVQAAFPLRAQLEEIKRALRLQNLQQAAAEAQVGGPGSSPGGPPPMITGPRGGSEVGSGTPPPVGLAGMFSTLGNSVGVQFAGFDVMRREISPSGEDLGWAPYDHEAEYFTKIRARRINDQPDNPYLIPFIRYDQRMAAPLPELADNLAEYPPLRISAITDAINKLKADQTPVPTAKDWQKRFSGVVGDQNPYLPSSRGGAAVGQPGSFGPGASGPMSNPPGGMAVGGPPPGPGGMAPGMNPQATALPDMDTTLIRFLDSDVKEGYSYQYQIRVRIKNPNYRKTQYVREPNDANIQYLEGPWVVLPEVTTLPSETSLYAYDTAKYLEKGNAEVKEINSNAGKFKLKSLYELNQVQKGEAAVVQVQQWLPQVRATGDRIEPIGAWICAEIPAAIGEYIGRRQLIKLPLWNSAVANFVLRELTAGVKIKDLDDKYQPKGWPVNFRTRSLLVDFEGGEIQTVLNGRDVRDEAETEMLILGQDGKLRLKSSAADMANRDRTSREETWNAWLQRVRDRKDAQAAAPAGPGSNNPGSFSR